LSRDVLLVHRRRLLTNLRFSISFENIEVDVLLLKKENIVLNNVLVHRNVRLVDGNLIVRGERLGSNSLGFQFGLDWFFNSSFDWRFLVTCLIFSR
jgi:hypothetical protein